MYVLTKGWYSDWKIFGVTSDPNAAEEWRNRGDERDYYGPFEEGTPQDAD